MTAVGERLGQHFGRCKPRQRALGYICGLLSDTERKNGWQLAEHLGDPTADGVQHLLARAAWDANADRDDLTRSVAEHLGQAGGQARRYESFLLSEPASERDPASVG